MAFNRKTYQYFVFDNFKKVKNYLCSGVNDRNEEYLNSSYNGSHKITTHRSSYTDMKVGDILISKKGISICLNVTDSISGQIEESCWVTRSYSNYTKKEMQFCFSELKKEDTKFNAEIYSYYNSNKEKSYIKKIKNEKYNRYEYYSCQLDLNLNPSDSDIWDSFFTLYSIIGYASTQNEWLAASIDFEDCVKVVNRQIANPMRFLLSLGDQHMKYIFNAFGIEDECNAFVQLSDNNKDNNGSVKGVTYDQRIKFLEHKCEDISDNDLHENSKKIIQLMFLRKQIRNSEGHSEVAWSDPVGQMRKYLMDHVMVVYLIKHILNIPLVVSSDYLNDMKENLYYPVTVEEGIVVDGEGAINNNDHRYYIPAFKKYVVRNVSVNESIDLEITNLEEVSSLEIRSFNGKLTVENSAVLDLINRIEYNPILESIQRQLSDIRNSVISEEDVRNIVEHNMPQFISDVNKQIEKIYKDNKESIRLARKELLGVEKDYKDNIDEISSGLVGLRNCSNEHEARLQKHDNDINIILTGLEDTNLEVKNIKKKRRIISRVIVSLLFIAISAGSIFVYLRYGDNIPQVMYGLAYKCGNKDAAYKNAVILENEKNNNEAAGWYLRACEKYAKLLAYNPNDSIRALRLAEMMMRGKGGIINKDTAQYYAHMAKRYDLEALLAIYNGDVYRAKDLVNNLQHSKSAYFKLADALSTLLYPREHNAEEIKSCWLIVDSLASTTNEATQEALECAYTICSLGIIDKDDYIIAPSLYDAIAYAQDADIKFNSVAAQIYLASKLKSMNLSQDAEIYHAKAVENNIFGHGEITFSHDRINELTDDPQALLARAYNNSQKGYTDYRMTAYYYHIADSINTTRRIYKFGMPVYIDWFNYIINAEDVSTIDRILSLINKDYSDSIRAGMAEYVIAIKYAKGKGLSLDTEKSYEHLKKAADLGLEDAQVAIGILWDLDSVADGMNLLEKLAFRERSKIHPYAARYIMSKYYKQGEIIPELLKRSQDEFALLIKMNTLDAQDLSRVTKETLVALRQQINIVLSKKTDFYDSAFLLGKLAEIEYLLGRKDEADFYIGLAGKISPKDAYSSFFGISEIARKSGDDGTAAFFAGMFAKQFFLDKGRVRYEPARHEVLNYFYHLYPEVLDMVCQDKKFDFVNSGFIIHETNFDRERDFSTYESYVKKLPVELPSYEELFYPITLKYFD